MGLDNIPKPYPCEKLGIAVLNKDGKIVCKDTKCPFNDDTHPIGLFGTDCWFRGKWLFAELEAIGETEMANRCFENMSPGEAEEFGQELLEQSLELRKRHQEMPSDKRPQGACKGIPSIDLGKGKVGVTTDEQSTFEEVLEAIETGGKWYKNAVT